MFSDMESYLLRGVEGDPLFDLFLGMLSLSQAPNLEKDFGVFGEHWLTEFRFYLLEVPNSGVHAARLESHGHAVTLFPFQPSAFGHPLISANWGHKL